MNVLEKWEKWTMVSNELKFEMEFSQLIEPLISMEMNLICFYGFGI